MILAKELLEKGEKDAVLKYFQLCALFWKSGQNKLNNWTDTVQNGGMPDFAANLAY